MGIIKHQDIESTRGYYSKVTNSKKIVTKKSGATTFQLWEQTLPLGGYITPHTHEFEESLTFLTGEAVVRLDGEEAIIGPDTTIFIPAGILHEVRNNGDEPVRLIAVLAHPEPKVIYPAGPPNPVSWEDD